MAHFDLYNRSASLEHGLAALKGKNAETIRKFIARQVSTGKKEKRCVKQFYALKELSGILGKPFRRATPEDIDRVLKVLIDGGQSLETLRSKRIIFRQALRFVENPAAEIIRAGKKGTTHNPRQLILEPEDVRQLAMACTDLDYRLFTFLLFWTGGRVSEVASLRFQDCEVKDGSLLATLYGEKTDGSARIIPVKEPIVVMLFEEFIKTHPNRTTQEGFLFPSLQVSYATLATRMKSLKDAVGLQKPVRFHWFRHSFFTWFAEHGGTESAIMYLGGWKSADMAARYISSSQKLVMDKFAELYGKTEDSNDRLLNEKGSALLDKLLSKPERKQKIIEWIIEDNALGEWQEVKAEAKKYGKIEAPIFSKFKEAPGGNRQKLKKRGRKAKEA